jgi:uncharacterized protein YjbJ (UPF0337 family)
VINGRREQLVGKIQECYGQSRDEADRQVKTWERDLDSLEGRAGGTR